MDFGRRCVRQWTIPTIVRRDASRSIILGLYIVRDGKSPVPGVDILRHETSATIFTRQRYGSLDVFSGRRGFW